MKKAITLALVAAMLTATGITAFAAPITANSNPKTGGTDVTYAVDPVYAVVIPESVTLGDTAVTETIKIYGADENSNVVIGKKQKVNVALTASANDFKVKTADGETIAYTVNDKNAVADLTTVAECAAGAKQNTDITFKKTGETKYAGTYTDTLTFTVSLADAAVAVTGVTLNKTSLELTAGGDTETLTATVAPDTATDKTVTWSSDTPSVATVVNGVVTPVAAGKATITATAGGKSATCDVTVSAPSETITFNSNDGDIDDDNYVTFSGTYSDVRGFDWDNSIMVNQWNTMTINAKSGKTIDKVVFQYELDNDNKLQMAFTSGTFDNNATVNNVNATTLTVSSNSTGGTPITSVTIYYK